MSLVSDAANDNFIVPMNIVYHLFPYLTNSSKIYKNALVWSKQCAKQPRGVIVPEPTAMPPSPLTHPHPALCSDPDMKSA